MAPFMYFLKDDLKVSQDIFQKLLTYFINIEFKENKENE